MAITKEDARRLAARYLAANLGDLIDTLGPWADYPDLTKEKYLEVSAEYRKVLEEVIRELAPIGPYPYFATKL